MSDSEKSVIVFDADDTIFLLRETLGRTYSRILATHGITCLPHAIDFHAPVLWSEMRRLYLAQDNLRVVTPTSEKEFWLEFESRLISNACAQEPTPECMEEIYTFYSLAESRMLREGFLELLEYLSHSSMLCAIATNNDVRIHPLLEDLEIATYFSFTLSAAEVGAKKPSQKFFDAIQSECKLPDEDIIYIGNDIELDILPAMHRNWKAIMLLDGDRERPAPVPFIRSFYELLALLESSGE
jgi:FMN phosphatase YigB (HAD superfamily)